MKRSFKAICAALCVLIVFASVMPFCVFAEDKTVLSDDFESYGENAALTSGGEIWDSVVSSATSTVTVQKEGKSNKVLQFTNSADKNGGPRIEKKIYLAGVDDITFSFRAMTTADATAALSINAGSETALSVRDKYSSWTDVKIEINLKDNTFKTYKNGKKNSNGNLACSITGGASVQLTATVKGGSCAFFDDFKITTGSDIDTAKIFDSSNVSESAPSVSAPADGGKCPLYDGKASYKKAAAGKSQIDFKNVIYSENFDSYADNTIPETSKKSMGFSEKVTSATSTITVRNIDSSNVLRINNTAEKEGGPKIAKTIFNSGFTKIGLSYLVRTEDCNSIVRIANSTNTVLMNTNTEYKDWTRVDIIIDCEKNSYQLIEDGKTVKTEAIKDSVDGEFVFSFSSGHLNNNENVFYDDIVISVPDDVDVDAVNKGGSAAPVTIEEYQKRANSAYDGSPVPENTIGSGKTILFSYNSNYGGTTISKGSSQTWQSIDTTDTLKAVSLKGNEVIIAVNNSVGKKKSNLTKLVSLGLDASDMSMEFNVYFMGSGSVKAALLNSSAKVNFIENTKEFDSASCKSGWNTIRYEFDFKNKKYSSYLNGQEIEKSAAFSQSANDFSDVNVKFTLCSDNTDSIVAFDNALISTKTPIRYDSMLYGTEGVSWDKVKGSEITEKSFVSNLRSHPRLYITDWNDVRNKISTSPKFAALYNSIKKTADEALSDEFVPYTFTNGRNWLWGAREVANRARALSFVYCVTGDKKYKDRAVAEIKNAGTYPDWSPSAPMIAAEGMDGVAIAYDWLYNDLTAEEKADIINILKKHVLWQYVNSYEGKVNIEIARGTSNRTMLANGSGLMCAVAIADEEKELANYLYENALKYEKQCFEGYGVDGGYSEGTRYWELSTSYAAKFIGALMSAPVDGYEYDSSAKWYMDNENIKNTGKFYMYLNSSNKKFAYGDSEPNLTYPSQIMYFLAKYADEPMYQWYMDYFMEKRNVTDSSYLVFAWYDENMGKDPGNVKKDVVFNSNNVAVATTRSSFTDTNALWAAIQGGGNMTHLFPSLGTFAIDYAGQRFIETQAGSDYNSQFSSDWYYVRRTEGQNTIVINPNASQGQKEGSVAMFEKSDADDDEFYAVLDMTKTYDVLDSAKRGIKMTKGRESIVIQDEMKLKSPSEIYWFAQTSAAITLSNDKRSALLEIGGEKMMAQITNAPNGAGFEIMQTRPLPTSPIAPDDVYPDKYKLAIHMTNVTEANISVEFIPIGKGEAASSKRAKPYEPISAWTLTPDANKKTAGDIVSDGVALEINNPLAFGNGHRTFVDSSNDSVFPFIIDGRTLVPVRFISENLGSRVAWDDATRTVTVIHGTDKITLKLGSKEMNVNGNTVMLDVPADVYYDRTMIPLRALSEALGKKVFWDNRGLILIGANEFNPTEEEINTVFDELGTRVFISGSEFAEFRSDKTDYTAAFFGDNSVTVKYRGEDIAVALDESGAHFKAGERDYNIAFAANDFENLIGTESDNVISRAMLSIKTESKENDNFIHVNNVTMSTGHDKYPSTGTIDNIINDEIPNRWSGNGSGAYLIYDLGEIKNVNSMGIATYKGDTRKFLFSVEVSEDGDSYSEIINTETSGTTKLFDLFDLGDVRARYIKVIGYGDSDGGPYNSWTELRFYESAAMRDADKAIWQTKGLASGNDCKVGDTLNLEFTAFNSKSAPLPYGEVRYTSSDEKVASVDKNGVVKVNGSGNAQITAVTNNGFKDVSATVMLTIK